MKTINTDGKSINDVEVLINDILDVHVFRRANTKVFHAILIGLPGVGKGTQCQKLRKKIDYIHVRTGDLVRSEIANKTETGK